MQILVPDPKPVKRCVCGQISFARLYEAGVRSLEDAHRHGAGLKCKACVPYLLHMIATGQTEFPIFETDS
jgi:hypothetical protein